jgi:hypothetical protein
MVNILGITLEKFMDIDYTQYRQVLKDGLSHPDKRRKLKFKMMEFIINNEDDLALAKEFQQHFCEFMAKTTDYDWKAAMRYVTQKK